MKEPKHHETVWYSVPPEKTARQLGEVAGRIVYQPSETVTVPVEEIDAVEDPALREALHRQDLSNKSSENEFVVPIADEHHKLVRVIVAPKHPISLREPADGHE